MTMSSGLAFDEDYDNFMSDVMWLPIRIFGFGEPIDQILNELEREREAGRYNNYVSSDSGGQLTGGLKWSDHSAVSMIISSEIQPESFCYFANRR